MTSWEISGWKKVYQQTIDHKQSFAKGIKISLHNFIFKIKLFKGRKDSQTPSNTYFGSLENFQAVEYH